MLIHSGIGTYQLFSRAPGIMLNFIGACNNVKVLSISVDLTIIIHSFCCVSM